MAGIRCLAELKIGREFREEEFSWLYLITTQLRRTGFGSQRSLWQRLVPCSQYVLGHSGLGMTLLVGSSVAHSALHRWTFTHLDARVTITYFFSHLTFSTITTCTGTPYKSPAHTIVIIHTDYNTTHRSHLDIPSVTNAPYQSHIPHPT